jgi:hypothetical protein
MAQTTAVLVPYRLPAMMAIVRALTVAQPYRVCQPVATAAVVSHHVAVAIVVQACSQSTAAL